MASGDTKTQQYLDIAAHGTRSDLQRGCCNTRTQDLIMDVAERIITEEETRAAADRVLQGEIDEIKNNPDVYDIVATYADLQNYDTSTITDKDVIRVLRDETHDNASTYYRWDAADQKFDYIGEVGDYYTKAQADALLALKADKATTYTKTEVGTLLDGKQDELTAGDNITIEDESGALVISATDTTYSNFVGTDGTAAGTAGLVPAPATTDAGKFLKADGTWGTAGGGSSYTAGDGIDITNAVISATNTGKAKELTTDDYDYPDNNPDGVAIWRLDSGTYVSVTGVKKYFATNKYNDGSGLVFVDADEPSSMFFSTYGDAVTLYRTDNSGGIVSSYPRTLLMSNEVVNNLTSVFTARPLSANQGKVLKDLADSLAIRGAGAPTTSTVGQVGTLYEDTTNGDLYICTDATNPYVWEEVGGGGGPTVVQTPGTSTTDVMSQNAVSSMVFADPATQRKVKIGYGTSSSEGAFAVEIGIRASAIGMNSVAIGNTAAANSTSAVSIGLNATSGGSGSIAIGDGATVAGTSPSGGIAMGVGAKASNYGTIALGTNSGGDNMARGEMNIGTSSTSDGYNNSNYRLISGVYDGQSAHDAATYGQLSAAIINGGTTAPTTSTVGTVGTLYSYVDTSGQTPEPHLTVCTAVSGNTYTWTDLLSGIATALQTLNQGTGS